MRCQLQLCARVIHSRHCLQSELCGTTITCASGSYRMEELEGKSIIVYKELVSFFGSNPAGNSAMHCSVPASG